MVAVEDRGDYETLVRRHIASFASLGALRVLREHGPTAPQDVAARIGISPSEASRALHDLAAAGLVERASKRGAPRFVLTAEPALRTAVESLLERYEDDRHFRTCLVLNIVRRMSAETYASSQV